MSDRILDQLLTMSRRLGDPAKQYVILGEGNTSAQIDDESFYVKASGKELETIGPEGFCSVYLRCVLEMLDEDLTDEQVKDRLDNSCVHGTLLRPSVETVLHALLLELPGVRFVAHTHPVSVNAILCSQNAEQAIAGRLFPDEIVSCGVAPVWVPYTDPGLPLARAVREAVRAYIERYGERPRQILMQNHGLIALGESPQQVEGITAMSDKAARILFETAQFGGPRFLSEEDVARIHTRPDEKYRQRLIEGGAGTGR